MVYQDIQVNKVKLATKETLEDQDAKERKADVVEPDDKEILE